MPYALSNIGQGATAYGAITPWTRPASGDWWIRIRFSVNDTGSNQHLVGRSDSTAGSLRVAAGGILRLRDNGGDLISSASGTIVAGTIYTARFGRSGSNFFLELDGVPVGTATYAASQITNPMNQLMRFSTTLYGVGVIYEFETSGGTYNTLLNGSNAPSTGTTWTDGISTITVTNFTGAANSWWLFYSTGSAFAGDIIKASLSLQRKTPTIATGLLLNPAKQGLTVGSKALNTTLGFNGNSGKLSLSVVAKQLASELGYNVASIKNTLTLSNQTVSISAGQVINAVNNSLSVSNKPLDTRLGFNSTLSNNTFVVNSINQDIAAGQFNDIQEQHLVLAGKGITLATGTEVSFLGDITNANLTALGKYLSLTVGESVPFQGDIVKTSLTVSGKVLDNIRGQVLDAQKQSLNLVSKQLIFGLPTYPAIPVSRLFIIKEQDRVYLMKQTTNVFILKQTTDMFTIK